MQSNKLLITRINYVMVILSKILILKRKSHSKTVNFFARTTIDQEDEYVLFSVKVSLRAIKSLIIFLFFNFCFVLPLFVIRFI